jgi:hypothetical protein
MNETELRIIGLSQEILSDDLRPKARHQGDEKSWTRNRKMPLPDVITCTLNKKGLTTEIELRQYFNDAEKLEEKVCTQSYFEQRVKLNPLVFEELNGNYLRRFYESEDECKTWNGYVVTIVDGCITEIPNSEENRGTYGVSENQHGQGVARANMSTLCDLYNRFIIDIEVGHCNANEIEMAKTHIEPLKCILQGRPVIIIFDRGYASLEFINYLEKAGIKYLIRVPQGHYKSELEMMEGNDCEVALIHTSDRLGILKSSDPERFSALKEEQSTSTRIIKATLPNGEVITLMTNIKEYSTEEIKALYKERWEIEKKFHTLKNKMKFESTTGNKSIYVKQDFWAQTLVYNMVQDLMSLAQVDASKEAEEKEYVHPVRINENIAIGLFKEKLIGLMLEEDGRLRGEMFNQLIYDMKENILPVRDLKSKPRKWNKSNKYKCNLKPSF